MLSAETKKEESIMVIPVSILWKNNYFQGLQFDAERYLALIGDEKKIKFKKRTKIEFDPNYKQIIPYAIFLYQNTILSYRRGKLLIC